MNIPQELKYAATHEWIRVEGETGTIGITDHAQHELSDVVFVELPKKGQKIIAGKECAVVESVKAASDIYAPISGEVTEINQDIVANPALVNTDPYGKGWFFKIKPTNLSDLGSLKNADGYKMVIGK